MDQFLYCGLDLHKRFSYIVVKDDAGRQLKRGKVVEGSKKTGKTGHVTIHSPIQITGTPTIIVSWHSAKGTAYGTWLWEPSEGEGLRVVWEWKFVGTTPPEAWLRAGYVGPVEVLLINQKHYEQWGHWWGFGESERKWGYTYGNKTEKTSGYAYTDSDGWQNIKEAYLLINTSTSGFHCLYAYYDRMMNRLCLRNDIDSSWLGGFAPTSSNVIENYYVKLDCSRTTISGSGNTLTVNWRVTFKPTFTGSKNTYLYVKDIYGAYNGWIQKGTWAVTSATPPQITITEPINGAIINAEP